MQLRIVIVTELVQLKRIQSTAVLGNEAQETDLNENTGTGGHESKGDGSLNGDTDMNGGHEIEGDDSLTVTNSNRDRAGSVKEDTCSTGVLGNEAQETEDTLVVMKVKVMVHLTGIHEWWS